MPTYPTPHDDLSAHRTEFVTADHDLAIRVADALEFHGVSVTLVAHDPGRDRYTFSHDDTPTAAAIVRAWRDAVAGRYEPNMHYYGHRYTYLDELRGAHSHLGTPSPL